MRENESTLPRDWFAQGDLDLQAAEILLTLGGPLPIVAFHLQQAVEKYLKGFLLSTGWTLRRIHDLELLLQDAIDRDEDFAPFLPFCQRATEYYLETRYPLGIQSPLEEDALKQDLDTARELIALIRRKVFSQRG
ncbi:MAG: HEPN domain-containing protein [Thermoflexales bacterium]|nr:HEPN domain-containing protein [Thermoflexales bacterium]